MKYNELQDNIKKEFGVNLDFIRIRDKTLSKWYSVEYNKIRSEIYSEGDITVVRTAPKNFYSTIRQHIWEAMLRDKDLIKFYLL